MTTTIYCLACDDIVWYVGRTRKPEARESFHKGKYASYGSSLIPDGVKWKFIILEVVNVEDAPGAEKFYYDYLQPRLNKQVPGRTNTESKAAWIAANYDRHLQQCREYQRAYYLRSKNAN